MPYKRHKLRAHDNGIDRHNKGVAHLRKVARLAREHGGEAPPVRTECPMPHKPRYATLKLAEQAAMVRSPIAGETLGAYRCPCGWHHLHSKTKANRKREAARQRAEFEQERARLEALGPHHPKCVCRVRCP